MSLFSRIFTWWNGSTIGTTLFTSRFGEKVGEDDAGNVFYQTAGGARRWVNLFLGGRLLDPDAGLDSPLHPGELLWIIPAVAGG